MDLAGTSARVAQEAPEAVKTSTMLQPSSSRCPDTGGEIEGLSSTETANPIIFIYPESVFQPVRQAMEGELRACLAETLTWSVFPFSGQFGIHVLQLTNNCC